MSPTKQKGWADWAYNMRHRAREELRIITDPPMARSEIHIFVDLLRPVRRGLAFPDGIPEVHADMFFEHWMASSFFLEMVARWAAPHRREDLWRALSVVQYPSHWNSANTEQRPSLTTYPLIQVLWYEVQKQGLYFVRLHPGLTPEVHRLAASTADSSRGGQDRARKR